MNFNFIISLTLVFFSISSILPPSSSQDVDALTQQYGGLIQQSLGAVSEAAKENGGGAKGLQNLIQSTAAGKGKCVKQLMPCQEYFKASAPPKEVAESCCQPMRLMVADDMDCLCGISKTEGILKSINVTMDALVNVAKACSADPDFSSCDGTDNSPSPAPAMTDSTEPATSGPTLESPSMESPALEGPSMANSPAPSSVSAATADHHSGGLRMYNNMEKSSLIVLVLTSMFIAFF